MTPEPDATDGWCCDGRTWKEHSDADGDCCQPHGTHVDELPPEGKQAAQERLERSE